MLNRSLFLPLLFGSLMACTPLIVSGANPVLSASPPATPVRKSSTAPAKTTTIQVGGRPKTIPLNVMQTPVFSTYFPTDRFTLKRDRGNITLYWKKPDGTLDRNTFIAFISYDKNQDFNGVRAIVDVNAQILQGIGWRRIEQSSGVSYAKRAYSAWLRDLIRLESRNLRTEPPNAAATAYLGEVNGQVFIVFSSYRFQYEDEFTPREDVVLKNLKMKN